MLAACGSRQPSDPGANGTGEVAAAPSADPSVTPAKLGNVTTGIDQVQPWQEEFYKDLHRHPDLWGEEARTAEKVTKKLQEIGADEVLQIGGGVCQHQDEASAPHGAGPTQGPPIRRLKRDR